METTHRLEEKLTELFAVLPLDCAMGGVGQRPGIRDEGLRFAGDDGRGACEIVLGVSAGPSILAGLWLYVDELERSHSISQGIPTSTGAYWHGIMHRREGDFGNAKYWFRQVGDHPVIAEIGYDPFLFIDACEADGGRNDAGLIDLQRREWKTLFDRVLREEGGF